MLQKPMNHLPLGIFRGFHSLASCFRGNGSPRRVHYGERTEEASMLLAVHMWVAILVVLQTSKPEKPKRLILKLKFGSQPGSQPGNIAADVA